MVFERASEFPTTEAHLPDCPTPQSAYGFSKLTGEVYCRAAHDEHGLPYTICRPFDAYGPGEAPDAEPGIAHSVPDLIAKVLSGQRPLQIFGSGEQTRTLTHVRRHRRRHRRRDELAGGTGRGLQHLRRARADGRRDRADRLGGLRRGPRGLRAGARCRASPWTSPAAGPRSRRPASCSAGRRGSSWRTASPRPCSGSPSGAR